MKSSGSRRRHWPAAPESVLDFMPANTLSFNFCEGGAVVTVIERDSHGGSVWRKSRISEEAVCSSIYPC